MEKNKQYVAPEIFVVECQVEKGYATTSVGFGDEIEEASTRPTPSWWFEDK